MPGASSPVLSPDGTRVAYVVGGELRVQSVGGGPARTLTQIPERSSFAFAANGTRIAFVAEDAIIVIPVVGKGPIRRLSLPTSWGSSTFGGLVSSSAGGFAFWRTFGDASEGTLRNELDYVDAHGAAGIRLRNASPLSRPVAPAFSPDGSLMVVSAGERRGLVSLPTGLGRRVQLTRGDEFGPVYSPDGKWIAFSRRPPRGAAEIWVMRPDGTGARRVTTTPPLPNYDGANGSRALAWSPDGRHLLAQRNDRLAIVAVSTGATHTLAQIGAQLPAAAAWR